MIQDDEEMKKVLIIDDDLVIQEMLRCILSREGYEVAQAFDGKDALQKAQAELPDLVLLDVMMPKLNGWEVAKAMKTDENLKHIPIIMLTSKSQKIDKIMGYEAGVDEYLVKPFDPMSLLRVIGKFSR